MKEAKHTKRFVPFVPFRPFVVQTLSDPTGASLAIADDNGSQVGYLLIDFQGVRKALGVARMGGLTPDRPEWFFTLPTPCAGQ